MKNEKYKLKINDDIASVNSASLANRRALPATSVFAAEGRVTFASRHARFLSRTSGMILNRGASMISPALLPHRKRAEHTARAAFTLVEMLVAVGLVVLMMTLFAQIFQMATGTMQTQKGLSENDQRVRLVMNLLRNDLNSDPGDQNNPKQHRTFRLLIPYGTHTQEILPPLDPATGSAADNVGMRSGYFYISEGNVFDDTDDVLQFTVALPVAAPERLYGKAGTLLRDAQGRYGIGNPPPMPGTPLQAGQAFWPNQPEFDDQLGTINQAGSSTTAEVCYFLRAGTLYRRVLLVRQPYPLQTTLPADGNPTNYYPPPNGQVPATPLNLTDYTGSQGNPAISPSRSFWNDFDYSAFNDLRKAANGLPGFEFNSTGSQSDSLTVDTFTILNPFSLSNPACRFGFDSTQVAQQGGGTVPGPSYGLPREYVVNANGTFFIGRFTHRETSDPTFVWPAATPIFGNPMSQSTPLGYQSNSSLPNYGVVTYGNNSTPLSGPRAGEDVVMTNVMKFDIKVWDPAASYGGDNSPGFAGVDDDNNGIVDFINNNPTQPDPGEIGWPGSDDGDFVDIGHLSSYGYYNAASSGNVYYSNPLLSGNPVTPSFTNRYDTWDPNLDLDGDTKIDFPPYRPIGVGPDGRPGMANVDDDNDGTIDNATELGWPGTDDFIPLSAIQIKISFYDGTSKQLREVTLVHRLLP